MSARPSSGLGSKGPPEQGGPQLHQVSSYQCRTAVLPSAAVVVASLDVTSQRVMRGQGYFADWLRATAPRAIRKVAEVGRYSATRWCVRFGHGGCATAFLRSSQVMVRTSSRPCACFLLAMHLSPISQTGRNITHFTKLPFTAMVAKPHNFKYDPNTA